MVTEEDESPAKGPDSPRGGAEALAMDYAEQGVHSVSLRFAPTVHGPRDHGFIALITAAARQTGVSAYVGDGANAWSAVHRLDAAKLVTLALASAPAGSAVHVVAEEAVPTKDIAEAIGGSLDLPVQSVAPDKAVDHFGFIGAFFAMDLRASSAATRDRFDWRPSQPTLLEDIAAGAYTG